MTSPAPTLLVLQTSGASHPAIRSRIRSRAPRRPGCGAGAERHCGGDQIGVARGRGTVGQHEHVLEADADGVPARDRGRQHVPRPLVEAVPQLRNLGRDQLGDRASLVGPALDLDQDAQNLVGERAGRELLGIGGRRDARFDRDPGVQCGTDDARPPELGQVDRDEVGRAPPRADGRGARERVRIDRRRGREPDRQTRRRGADRRHRGVARVDRHRLAAAAIARMHVHRERAGPPDRDRVGGELRRRLRNRGVLGPRAPAVQACLHRDVSHGWRLAWSRGSGRTVSEKLRDVVGIDLTVPDLHGLHERAGAKWSRYPADVLSATIAEMDFPLAPPVAEALHRAIDRADLGYPRPATATLRRAFAGFAARRLNWTVDEEQIVLVPDVMIALVELCRAIVEPGEAVAFGTPAYPPFFNTLREAGVGDLFVELGPMARSISMLSTPRSKPAPRGWCSRAPTTRPVASLSEPSSRRSPSAAPSARCGCSLTRSTLR